MTASTPSGPQRGRFITFEGGEGTGKSTQVRRLADLLARAGVRTALSREPGGSPGAEAIRHVLLTGAAAPLGSFAEALLFAAARHDHVANVIRPALAEGTWVICDRFADSTRVYQGALGKVAPGILRGLERIACDGITPDLTIVLDIPPEIGLDRARQRRGAAVADRFEQEALSFHQRIRDAYRSLAAAEPSRCALVDASGTADEVAHRVAAVVHDRLVLPAAAPAEGVT